MHMLVVVEECIPFSFLKTLYMPFIRGVTLIPMPFPLPILTKKSCVYLGYLLQLLVCNRFFAYLT